MLSPNVAKVLNIAVTRDGVPCIVFELLEGETLGQRVARHGGLSLVETAEVVKQVARALARAHVVGVIHRDVKPDNIFLTTDSGGRLLVKLLDFGIAVAIDEQGTYSHAQLAGTPEYMAPEILFGTHELDERADIYALGIVVFECLTGRCPFWGGVQHIFEQLRAGISPAFTDYRPDLVGALDDWMDRALQADPFWRFHSVSEMSEAFEDAIVDVVACPQSSRITIPIAA